MALGRGFGGGGGVGSPREVMGWRGLMKPAGRGGGRAAGDPATVALAKGGRVGRGGRVLETGCERVGAPGTQWCGDLTGAARTQGCPEGDQAGVEGGGALDPSS